MKALQVALEKHTITLKRGCAERIRKNILEILRELGWSNRVSVHPELKVTITAARSSVGLCLQTSNVARLYADILKMQVLYESDHIESAIYLVPTITSAKQMGSNIVNFTRVTHELPTFRHIITVPIVVIGFGGE